MKTSRQMALAILLPALLAAVFPARAENPDFILPFGGEPGAPLAHSYDYGTSPLKEGTYAMRIPAVDVQVASVLHDTELTVDAATKTVQRVYASRAFKAVADCEAARTLLNGKIEKVLPVARTGGGQWLYQSADGRVAGGAWCQTERYLPFITLFLELTLLPPAP
ncbi:MAG: hypothetical protein RL434_3167 [Pseudomonadota bacterium]|jgi:hypothetical protein